MPASSSKKILLVPLDWGLGHSTRCVPIIQALLDLGHEVHIGGTDTTNALLRTEFPDLVFHKFPSYCISYPNKGAQFLRHIMRQLPRIAKSIRQERKLTKELARQHSFDIIISDNRFGVRAHVCKNIFISHQLYLHIPQSKLMAWAANMINRFYINQYHKMGVPDFERGVLSGKLSETKKIKIPVRFLGCLSRWDNEKTNKLEAEGVLVILSGPEPQRTLLENMIISQSESLDKKLTIIRAKPNDNETVTHDNITFYNHVPSKQLKELAQQSACIISRAGYSTIMDMVAIQKNAILIPTPGQTEQEYLAKHLADLNLFTFYNQEGFDLSKAVLAFEKMEWGRFPILDNELKSKIAALID